MKLKFTQKKHLKLLFHYYSGSVTKKRKNQTQFHTNRKKKHNLTIQKSEKKMSKKFK